MAWVKLDDGFTDHPKILALTDRAFRLHVAAMCYSGRYLTDGYIDPGGLRRVLAVHQGRKRDVDALVQAGIWEPDGDGGYHIHDWLDWNRPAEKVKHVREESAKRQQQYRDRRKGEGQSNAVTNAVTNGVTNTVQSSPVQS